MSKKTGCFNNKTKMETIKSNIISDFNPPRLNKCLFFLVSKRIRLITVLALFFIFGFGSHICHAGFEGPGSPTLVNTVKAALEAPDDAPCVLQGKIEAKMPNRKNRYLFADQTGRIVVEIKKKVFGSLTITPQNIVRLVGEVDWDSKHENEVEVDSLTIVQ